jgi:tRNA-splicing ligase RtcB (3'-phosphate/5'-hydroxy nucleic acid ligase)
MLSLAVHPEHPLAFSQRATTEDRPYILETFMDTLTGKYGIAHITIPLDTVEDSCVAQIRTFLDNPTFTATSVIMPDTHAGKGAVIGFTMPLTDRVIPFMIGGDIGCSIMSFPLAATSIDHVALDQQVRAKVPFGKNVHDRAIINMEHDFPWDVVNRAGRRLAAKLMIDHGIQVAAPRYGMDWFLAMCKRTGADPRYTMRSLGTLGGGNHFIEIGRSANSSELWCTVHTGSRNLGQKVANYWQNLAKRFSMRDRRDLHRVEIERIRAETKDRKQIGRLIAESKERHDLNNKTANGLEWLEGKDMAGYLFDMIFAQAYADMNRRLIAKIICKLLGTELKDEVVSVHNFIDFDDWIIRKGAIRSYEGELMVIPFNMHDGVLICEGKSNADWNFSGPHGAGRVMSRTAAKKNLKLDEFRQEMEAAGIFSTSVCAATLDEARQAYKPAAFIEEAIAPTAHVVDRLVTVHSMKDKEESVPWRKRRKS